MLLAAVAALLALPLPAQAQTTTFVSNLGQTDSSSNAFSAISTPRAQQFETGSNSGGYTLTEIVVNIRGARTGIPAFALYTSTTDDKPGTKVVDLSGNSSTAGEQSFTPASATTLSASTEYFIVFVVDSGEANLQRTASNDIDSGASTGWDIAENSLFSTDSGANWTSSGSSVEIAIKGTAVGGTDNTVPGLDSATVDGTALVLTYDEALDTGSVPGSTAYEVTVAGATRTLAAMNPVAVSGSTVTLTLSSAARYGETVTLDYAVPTSNPVQDSAGNDAAALTDQDVANDTAAPGVSVAATSATEGTDLVFTVTLSEASGRVAAIQYPRCWRSCESEEMWTAVDGRQRRFGLVRRCFWLSSASRFL